MGAIATNPLTSDITSRALATKEGFTALYAVNKHRHKMIGLVDYLGGQSRAKKIDSNNGVISSMKMDNYMASSQITAATTYSGGVATVTLANSTEAAKFRIGFAVTDKFRNVGIVSAISSAVLTVRPLGTNLVAPAFAEDDYISETYNVSITNGSTSTNYKKYLPDIQENYLQISRETMSLSAMEYVKTYIDVTQGSKEYAAAQIQKYLSLRKLADSIESRMFIGKAAQNVTIPTASGALTATGNTNGGIDWAIANRGGTAIEWSGAAFPDEDTLMDYFTTLRSKTGMVSNHFVVVAGEKARQAIATLLKNYKVTAGINSVLQGEGLAVDGVNTTFGYVEFCDSWFLADPYANPQLSTQTGVFSGTRKMAWEFYIFCVQPVVDLYSMDAPLIQLCYKDTQGITTSYVEGLIDANGNRISGATASSTDGVVVEYYTNSGIDVGDASPMLSFKLSE